MLKEKKKIFGKERELDYDSVTGLIQSEGKFSRPLFNLAIKTARIFLRRSSHNHPGVTEPKYRN